MSLMWDDYIQNFKLKVARVKDGETVSKEDVDDLGVFLNESDHGVNIVRWEVENNGWSAILYLTSAIVENNLIEYAMPVYTWLSAGGVGFCGSRESTMREYFLDGSLFVSLEQMVERKNLKDVCAKPENIARSPGGVL